jgi:hypothetical protein
MESDSIAKARIKKLHEEMDVIHRANLLYWKQGGISRSSSEGRA